MMHATGKLSNTCPAGIDPKLWEGMSADARYQAQREGQAAVLRSRFLYQMTLSVLIAPPLLFMALPPVQSLIEGFIAPEHYVRFDGFVDPQTQLNETVPVIGDTIAGFAVTDDYGDRIHPVTGLPDKHRGVDIATPTGTPLYAPAVKDETVTVQCWQDTNGGGTVAEISSQSIRRYRFKALHLSECNSGTYHAGAVFAKTGATGLGTGAHLDFRQLATDSDQTLPPMTGYIDWVLSGSVGENLIDIPALKEAIVGQESDGNPHIVNNDSGALGLGQVMPENLAKVDKDGNPLPFTGWDYEALGKDITATEFLASPDLQHKIIDHQLNEIALSQSIDSNGQQRSPIEIARRTAAVWYSGRGDYCDSTKAEQYGDTLYPSGTAYCAEVAERFAASIQQRRQKALDK
jgi:hypothetical protein